AAENPRARLCVGARRRGAGVEARRPAHAGARLPAARYRRRGGSARREVVMPAPRDDASFARQLERLEEIVRRLEGQELDLDAALKLFEAGVERLRQARDRLAAAEAKGKRGPA